MFFNISANDDIIAMKQTDVRKIEDLREDEENQCPLCQKHFTSEEDLAEHALSFHWVNKDGLDWLRSVVEGEKRIRKRKEMILGEITQEQERPVPQSAAGKGMSNE